MVRLWKNNRGSAMVASMIAAVLVVGASTVAYKNFNLNHDSVRVARIRNLMTVVETQVRRRALQPEAYTGCNSAAAGVADCQISPGFYNEINAQNVIGAKDCAGCGVRVDFPWGLNMGTNRLFRARVSYQGTEAKLKPIDIALEIPTEVLQADQIHCGARNGGLTPIFAGFDGNGAPICQGFANNTCPSGTFLRRVDVSARSIQCEPLPSTVDCGSDNKFVTFNWAGGNVQFTCNGLQDPPFTSRRTSRIPASTPAPTRDTAIITTRAEVIPVTVTTIQTETVTEVASPSPVPTPPTPPAPTCTNQEVSLGMGGGATPRYWGAFACTASCTGVFGPTSRCGGGCGSGYRGWMYCMDCRDDRVVCN